MSPLSDREQLCLDALSDTFERTWLIAERLGAKGPQAIDTVTSFLTSLADKGLVQKGGTRSDTTWRRVEAPEGAASAAR